MYEAVSNIIDESCMPVDGEIPRYSSLAKSERGSGLAINGRVKPSNPSIAAQVQYAPVKE